MFQIFRRIGRRVEFIETLSQSQKLVDTGKGSKGSKGGKSSLFHCLDSILSLMKSLGQILNF
jgi:hypothetical protein